jgi:hypothetical protein
MLARNRTAIDLLASLGTELMVLLLIVLAAGLALSRYFAVGRDRIRRVEVKLARRAAFPHD